MLINYFDFHTLTFCLATCKEHYIQHWHWTLATVVNCGMWNGPMWNSWWHCTRRLIQQYILEYVGVINLDFKGSKRKQPIKHQTLIQMLLHVDAFRNLTDLCIFLTSKKSLWEVTKRVQHQQKNVYVCVGPHCLYQSIRFLLLHAHA